MSQHLFLFIKCFGKAQMSDDFVLLLLENLGFSDKTGIARKLIINIGDKPLKVITAAIGQPDELSQVFLIDRPFAPNGFLINNIMKQFQSPAAAYLHDSAEQRGFFLIKGNQILQKINVIFIAIDIMLGQVIGVN